LYVAHYEALRAARVGVHHGVGHGIGKRDSTP
jgi:hypothetical protein